MEIAVIGLGYVGLPLALSFVKAGITVLGIDSSEAKLEEIKSGSSIGGAAFSQEVDECLNEGSLRVSSDYSEVRGVMAIMICVPTPLSPNRDPDISSILEAAASIGPYLKQGALVALESTTFPGTTDGRLREVLEATSGMVAGEGFHLVFSPERIDPGNSTHALNSVPKVIGGLTKQCTQRAIEIYKPVFAEIVEVSDARTAEATKLVENIFRSVNIALVNELKIVYHKMGIDIWEVVEAAKTKPFGFMPFYPGPGLGGHCIPVDPFYLTWKAREYGESTRFIELAGEINSKMPDYIVGRIIEALNEKEKALNGSRILVLGLAYKPDVGDDRGSPAGAILEKLEARGAEVYFNDPFIPEAVGWEFSNKASVELSDCYDALFLCVAHRVYLDIDFSKYSCLVVDACNVANKELSHVISV